MVTIPRNSLDWKNEGFLVVSQQSILEDLAGFNFWYQAKDNIEKDKAIKKGLAGSNHEKLEAIPVLPEIKANTGVIQQRDAAIAESRLVPTIVLDDFAPIILFEVFRFADLYA